MLVERIFPKDSQRYIDIQKFFEEAGNFIEKFSIMRLFIIWSMTVCGTVLSAGLEDRFVYWDWSGSTTGLIKLAIVSAVLGLLFFMKIAETPSKVSSPGAICIK